MRTNPATVNYTVNCAYSQELLHSTLHTLLPQGWSIEHNATTKEKRSYYDTFSWQARAKNLVIVKKEKILSLYNIITGHEIATLSYKNSSSSFFAYSLASSSLKEHLQACTTLRAFSNYATIESILHSFRLLDAHQKTVAFLYEESLLYSKEDKPFIEFLSVSPLRGYEKEVEVYVALIRQHECVDDALSFKEIIDLILSKSGCSHYNYSSKIKLQLDGNATIYASSLQLLQASFAVMQINEDGIKQDIDTEFLHDYRVALRRTRSLLKQLKGVFDSNDVKSFQKHLKEVAQNTNALRDADVYLLQEERYTTTLPLFLQPALSELFRSIEKSRQQAHKAFCSYLTSSEYQTFIKEWSTFLIQPAIPSNEVAPLAYNTTKTIAIKSIQKAWKKVLHHGRAINRTASSTELHALRIDCKKLRYLLEFFASLFPYPTISQAVQQLKTLQDLLGDYVDSAVQIEFLYNQFDAIDNHVTAAALGGLMTMLFQQQEKARKSFHKTFRLFDDESTHLLFDKLLSF